MKCPNCGSTHIKRLYFESYRGRVVGVLWHGWECLNCDCVWEDPPYAM